MKVARRGCLHYLDHYEVDEESYGEWVQDGSTNGVRQPTSQKGAKDVDTDKE